MIQIRKAVSGLLTLTTSLSIGMFGLAGHAFAAQLTQASAVLDNSAAAASSVKHTIQFNVASTQNIGAIVIKYSTSATNSTVPANLSTAAIGTTPTVKLNGSANAGWTTQDGTTTNGTVTLARTTATSYTQGNTIAVEISSMTNNDLTSNCDGTADATDSCWIQIYTYQQTNSTQLVDQTAINYTVMTAISVTATVDPILVFTITPVAAASFGDSANVGTGTKMDTVSATSLPFGNLTAGTPKLVQQKLDVKTNANGGYKVYNNFVGSQIMVGTAQPSNNIDPFTMSSATWLAPQTWASPNGTANSVNSGMLGMRSSDSNVSQFGVGQYGPPTLTSNANIVMQSSGPDNGLRDVFVTYKLEVNAYQPADAYTGTTIYSTAVTY